MLTRKEHIQISLDKCYGWNCQLVEPKLGSTIAGKMTPNLPQIQLMDI